MSDSCKIHGTRTMTPGGCLGEGCYNRDEQDAAMRKALGLKQEKKTQEDRAPEKILHKPE